MKEFILPSIYWIVAFFVTLPARCRKRHKNLMLVSEKGNDARDNGYHFFLYVRQQHPEVDAYYVITDDSPDRNRLAQYEDHLVRYLSFRHCCLFWKAHYLVGTHLRAGHTPLPFVVVSRLNRLLNIYKDKKVANIKHGITKNFIDRMAYERTRYDLLVCGAVPERDYFVERYGYPESVARYTGFCRFDRLSDFQVKRQILVMPTWRSYIPPDRITASRFYQAYHALLTRLDALLEQYDIDLVFYPHHRFQPVCGQFKSGVTSPRIVVADLQHYDVQQLLKDSAVMITDYSSVLFDFVYMRKPVLFYQFDRDEFLSRHFKPGYVGEESFGPVSMDVDGLLEQLTLCLEGGMQLAPAYAANVSEFFPLHDTDNCKRVFDAVMTC